MEQTRRASGSLFRGMVIGSRIGEREEAWISGLLAPRIVFRWRQTQHVPKSNRPNNITPSDWLLATSASFIAGVFALITSLRYLLLPGYLGDCRISFGINTATPHAAHYPCVEHVSVRKVLRLSLSAVTASKASRYCLVPINSGVFPLPYRPVHHV